MGQAKARAAEINALKSQPTLVGFGAFYRDDEDDGFGINFPDTMPLAMLSDTVTKGIVHYNNAIGVDPDWFTKEMLAADLFRQMDHELVPHLNNFLCGNSRQLKKGSQMSVDIKPIIEELVIFACNVKWLQDNGYINCDEHNGMYYAYMTK